MVKNPSTDAMPTRVQGRSEEPGRIDLPGPLDFGLKNPTTKN